MASDLLLRRKITLRADERQIVLVKKKVESSEYVLMKAFLWAMYGSRYPDVLVEVSIGDRYKPDLVSLDPSGRPVFWGEAGKVSRDKLVSLLKRFPDTHFAFAKWATRLDLLEQEVRAVAANRRAPVDLLSFPPDSAVRFIKDGTVHVKEGLYERIRVV